MKNSWAFCALIFFWAGLSQANTSVGGGGDLFTHYLETIRYALKESIRELIPDTEGQKQFCDEELELSLDQKAECRSFFLATFNQMLAINDGQTPVEFQLSDDPLTVPDPFGQLREVDAKTELGPQGEITFNYNRVRNFSPQELLKLLTHESGHKSSYQGRYVTDNDPTTAFPRGRALLDSVGVGLADYAQRRHLVGSYFKVVDRFNCEAKNTATGAPISASQGISLRLFSVEGNTDSYEAGIGNRPLDFSFRVPFRETASEYRPSWLAVRVVIHEEHGCSQTATQNRFTRVDLVRSYDSVAGLPDLPDEVLASENKAGWNPACEEQPAPITVSYGPVSFECDYLGYEALSN